VVVAANKANIRDQSVVKSFARSGNVEHNQFFRGTGAIRGMMSDKDFLSVSRYSAFFSASDYFDGHRRANGIEYGFLFLV